MSLLERAGSITAVPANDTKPRSANRRVGGLNGTPVDHAGVGDIGLDGVMPHIGRRRMRPGAETARLGLALARRPAKMAGRGTAHHVADEHPSAADEWLAGAIVEPGTWWDDWDAWLADRSGSLTSAPKRLGSRRHKVVGPAPGDYVLERC